MEQTRMRQSITAYSDIHPEMGLAHYRRMKPSPQPEFSDSLIAPLNIILAMVLTCKQMWQDSPSFMKAVALLATA